MCLYEEFSTWIGLLSLYNGISNFVGYQMLNLSLLKDGSGISQTIAGRINGVHTFLICSHVNVIVRLRLELEFTKLFASMWHKAD